MSALGEAETALRSELHMHEASLVAARGEAQAALRRADEVASSMEEAATAHADMVRELEAARRRVERAEQDAASSQKALAEQARAWEEERAGVAETLRREKIKQPETPVLTPRAESTASPLDRGIELASQLIKTNASAGRLQEELVEAEGELEELHQAYAVIWEELKQQRAATLTATDQCVRLKAQIDGRKTPRTTGPAELHATPTVTVTL